MLVFWRHGYEATTLNDLTAAMGINPPSLYAAFGDKRRLFLEAVERYQRGPAACLNRALGEEPTAYGAIARLLREAALELTRPGRPAGCMVVSAATNCSPGSAEVQRDLARRRAENVAALQGRLERAVAEGELPRDVDVQALATFYATVFQGMTIQARDGAGPDRLMAVAETAMRAWPS